MSLPMTTVEFEAEDGTIYPVTVLAKFDTQEEAIAAARAKVKAAQTEAPGTLPLTGDEPVAREPHEWGTGTL